MGSTVPVHVIPVALTRMRANICLIHHLRCHNNRYLRYKKINPLEFDMLTQPFPASFRAPNNAAGKCWMDALELALRCSSLLLRSMSSTNTVAKSATNGGQVRFEFRRQYHSLVKCVINSEITPIPLEF